MKKIVFMLAASIGFLNAYAGNTWWVDNRAANAADTNSGTEQEPFLTIQAAADNPELEEGDTILVKPGTYASGGAVDAWSGMSNRVYLAKKVVLKSTGGKAATFIVGAKSPGSADEHGRGPNAVRCVFSETVGTIIEGFTLRGGTASTSGDAAGKGGCFCSKVGDTRGIYLVDCTIEDGAAVTGGGMQGGTAIRCLIRNNWTSGPACAVAVGNLFCSVVCNNTSMDGSIPYALNNCFLANCTIFKNTKSGATGASSIVCNCIFGGHPGSNYGGGITTLSGVSRKDEMVFVAWALEDFTLLKGKNTDATGGDPDTVGSAADLWNVGFVKNIPVGYAETDFFGNIIPKEGTIAAGAVVVSVEQMGGAIQANGQLMVDGHLLASGDKIYATSFPTQYNVRAVLAAGKEVFAFSRGSDYGGYAYPQMDDSVWITPPVGTENTMSLQSVSADKVLYVNPDPNIGSDAAGRGETAETPFLTLQKAVDSVSAGVRTIIHAAVGHYREGGKALDIDLPSGIGGGHSSLTNRVCITSDEYYVFLRGAGAGQSFMHGAADPNTKGNGPAAVRPYGCYSRNAALQGFTLTDGYSNNSNSPRWDSCGATAGGSSSGRAILLDCMVTGCHGYYGVSLYTLPYRCRFTENTAGTMVFYEGWLVNSAVYGNIVGAGGVIFHDSKIQGSTWVGAASGQKPSQSNSKFYASILVNATGYEASSLFDSTLTWNGAVPTAAAGSFAVGNPYFQDVENGKLALYPCSPAFTCMAEADAAYKDYLVKYASGDLNGNRMAMRASGVTVGCDHTKGGLANHAYVVAGQGGLSVVGGAMGDNVVPVAGMTLKPEPGTRPCIGVLVNGAETNRFDETGTVALSADTIASMGGAYLQALYGNDWYVDAEHGDDVRSGFLPIDAKRTLKGIFGSDVALLLSGDTVHAAAGSYSSGVMEVAGHASDSGVTRARVAVPAGVSLVGDAGRERTFIFGSPAKQNPDSYGRGEDAVRCVNLVSGASLRGFTLADGRTKALPSGGSVSDCSGRIDWIGGGVCCPSIWNAADVRKTVVADCIVSNCYALGSGAGCGVVFKNCRLEHCLATVGSACERAALVDTYVNDMDSDAAEDGFCVSTAYGLENVTVGPDVHRQGTLSAVAIRQPQSTDNYGYTNVCVLGYTRGIKKASSCVFMDYDGDIDLSLPDLSTCSKVSKEACALDGVGCPDPLTSVLVDRGDPYRGLGGTDANGGQRVYNGRIDVGAVEADWRPVYSKILGRRVTVDAVVPQVVAADAKDKVLIPSGGFEMSWKSRLANGSYPRANFTAKVSGTGTLTVLLNGATLATLTSADGLQKVFFQPEAEVTGLSFAYAPGTADTGAAEIAGFKSDIGMALIVR